VKFRKKWLDIPGLSQGNEKNQNSSRVWCGRTSACMIFNYYQKVAGKSDAELIVNNQTDATKPWNLVYSDGEIAADGFVLGEPLDRAVTGWQEVQLYPPSARPEASTAVTDELVNRHLEPLYRSIDNNNPALFFSGISMGALHTEGDQTTIDNAIHIVVICGYRVDDQGSIWLLITDPSPMIGEFADPQRKAYYIGKENLEVLQAGQWYSSAAVYWVRARRLFEKNERTTDPDDLLCDYVPSNPNANARPGFCVLMNADAATPDSDFGHAVAGFSLPLATRSAPGLQTIDWYFDQNEKEGSGGFFPLGANTVWHGGVHVHAERGALLVADADGTVVAARLPGDAAAAGHYGSTNFVLLRHEVKGQFLNEVQGRRTLPRLTTQVAGIRLRRTAAKRNDNVIGELAKGDELTPLDPVPIPADGFNWVRAKVAASAVPALANAEGWVAFRDDLAAGAYEVERLFDPEETLVFYSLYMHLDAVALEPGNQQLAPIRWLQTLHLTVESKSLTLRTAPNGAGTEPLLPKGTVLKVLDPAFQQAGEHAWGNVKVVESAAAAAVGRVGWVATEAAFVSPARRLDDEHLATLRRGEILRCDAKIASGDPIWRMGEYGSIAAPLVHWEVFSEKNLFPRWKTAEDMNDDFTADFKPIVDMVDQGLLGRDDVISAGELVAFYSDQAKARQLRTWACRFISEWAVDPDAAIPKMRGKFITRGLKEKYLPYLWWNAARAAGVPLPQDPRVWHYNPIAVAWAFNAPAGIDGRIDLRINEIL
jgi:hypothetical protein